MYCVNVQDLYRYSTLANRILPTLFNKYVMFEIMESKIGFEQVNTLNTLYIRLYYMIDNLTIKRFTLSACL